jgi:hypothetical protein
MIRSSGAGPSALSMIQFTTSSLTVCCVRDHVAGAGVAGDSLLHAAHRSPNAPQPNAATILVSVAPPPFDEVWAPMYRDEYGPARRFSRIRRRLDRATASSLWMGGEGAGNQWISRGTASSRHVRDVARRPR